MLVDAELGVLMKFYLGLLLLICAPLLQAGEVTPNMRVSLALDPQVRLTPIDGEQTVLLGGGARFTVNQGYYFSTVGMVSRGDVNQHFGRYRQIGGMLGRNVRVDEQVDYFTQLFMGSGNLTKLASQASQFEDQSDNFLVLEPGLGLSIVLAKPLRLNVGFSYRLVKWVDIEGVRDEDLSALSTHASLSLQLFDL
jgi:hypothetical protein